MHLWSRIIIIGTATGRSATGQHPCRGAGGKLSPSGTPRMRKRAKPIRTTGGFRHHALPIGPDTPSISHSGACWQSVRPMEQLEADLPG